MNLIISTEFSQDVTHDFSAIVSNSNGLRITFSANRLDSCQKLIKDAT
jgi:hypothetical protein